jgi:hypothetical protein
MEDWAQLISSRPDLVLRPTSMDELKTVLARIHRGELGDGVVRVLGRHGKSVTATGGTDHQTLAGLIATGTAAASSRYSQVPPDESEPDGDYRTDQSEHLLDFVFIVMDRVAGTGPLLNPALDAVYDVMTLTYGARHATGPLRNMLPVDRRAPLRVAMAEWSFRPEDVHRVIGECQDYFDDHGWRNIPTEIQLSRVDGALMSAWNWEGLSYVVKFNFMYLTEVCTKSGEKEAIYAHLRGLWDHLETAGVPFKAHWGKINFIDPEFVRRNHDFDAFRPLISPMFVNDHLAERIGQP